MTTWASRERPGLGEYPGHRGNPATHQSGAINSAVTVDHDNDDAAVMLLVMMRMLMMSLLRTMLLDFGVTVIIGKVDDRGRWS